MPHKCVRCGKVYEGMSNISTCECGAKMFFYMKSKDSGNANSIDKNLTPDQKNKIERDIYEIIGNELNEDSPVILDIEAINIKEPGKYELDLDKLSSGEALIYRFDEGKYIIDIAEAFNATNNKKKKKNR